MARLTEADEITPGWRFVAIVGDGQPVVVGDLDPWKHDWQAAGAPPIIVSHPSHPQRHELSVYSIVGHPHIVFAAGEFSNSVWGFYVPSARSF